MIEIGKEYWLKFGTHDNYEAIAGVVQGYNHPLIEFVENDGGKRSIINLACSGFMSASKRD